jgi:hypothetical protein
MQKKVKIGTQESVTYFAHAIDLAFAITVWKCQEGTFDYIIALLEHSPGSPTLTFEKLYVMFTRVKGLQILMFTTSSSIEQNKVISLTPKNSSHKMENGYWQRWVLETTCK